MWSRNADDGVKGMNSNRTQNAIRNIVWGLLNKIVLLILPFVNRTVLIYVLGSEYLGLDSLFSSILQFLNITELGFSSAVVFCMYKPVAEGDKETICALLNFYKKVYRVIGIIVLCLGLMLAPFLPKLIKSDLPDGLNLYFLYAIFLINMVCGYWLFAYKKAILLAHQRQDVESKINTTINMTKVILQIVLVFIIKNYYIYILVMPIATIIENIVVSQVTKRIYVYYVPCGQISKEKLADIKLRIYGLMIQKVCEVSRNSLDNIVISAFIGLTTVAIYGNYYYIMSGLHSLLSSITNSISAIVGNAIVKNTPEVNHRDMLKFDFMYMWLASIITICLVCIYQLFMIMWMGSDMLLPDYVMVAMCIYFYSLCTGDVRTIYYKACGLWWKGRHRSFLEAASNLVLNIILGKYFGIMGIVVATIISVVAINFCYGSTIVHRYYFKNIKMFIYYGHHIYYALVTVVVGIICYQICSSMCVQGVIGMVVRMVISLVIANVMLLIAYFKLAVFKDAYAFCKKSFKNRLC